MSKIAEALGKDVQRSSKKAAEKSKSNKSMPGAEGGHNFHVKQADGGGFVVETRKEGGGGFDPGTTSIHKSTASVKKHMDTCCGNGDNDE